MTGRGSQNFYFFQYPVIELSITSGTKAAEEREGFTEALLTERLPQGCSRISCLIWMITIVISVINLFTDLQIHEYKLWSICKISPDHNIKMDQCKIIILVNNESSVIRAVDVSMTLSSHESVLGFYPQHKDNTAKQIEYYHMKCRWG